MEKKPYRLFLHANRFIEKDSRKWSSRVGKRKKENKKMEKLADGLLRGINSYAKKYIHVAPLSSL